MFKKLFQFSLLEASAAKDIDVPILLSVGYAACHWCHVMAHESFENLATAALMNDAFVNIKVDREERPDIDSVYMTFTQALTGQGGWPMTVFLTPDLEPFYAGTYFPPTSRWGRPGFVDILQEIARVWRADRGRVETSAGAVIEHDDRDRTAARLTGRADRIELLADGRLSIVDYKTGSLPGRSDVELGFAAQLALEAAMARVRSARASATNRSVR